MASKILKSEALQFCNPKCKSYGKKGCLQSDIEGSNEEYVILADCMKREMESPEEKILELSKLSENAGDTFCVPDGKGQSPHIPPILKVRGKQTIKVAKWFVRHPNTHVSPLRLAGYCDVEHENTKKICKRLYNKGYIQQSLAGHYEYEQKIEASDLEVMAKMELIKLHDIRLKVPIQSGDNSHQTPVSGTFQSNRGGKGKTTNSEHQVSNSGTFEYYGNSPCKKKPEKTLKMLDDNGSVQAEIKITRYSKELEMRVKCTNTPLDVLGIVRLMGFIEGAGYSMEGAYLYYAEVNIDIPGVQIDGAQSIKLTDFKNCVQRYYNKKGKLRKEFHISGVVALEEVLAVMRGEQALGTNVLGSEVNEFKKELVKNNQHLSKTDNQYRQVVVKLDKHFKEESKLHRENELLREQIKLLKEQQEFTKPTSTDIMYS